MPAGELGEVIRLASTRGFPAASSAACKRSDQRLGAIERALS